MEKSNVQIIVLDNKEKEKLMKLWYTKVAYGDLVVGDSSIPLYVRGMYVDATREYSEYTSELLEKHMPGVEIESWKCDFKTGKLEIHVKE